MKIRKPNRLKNYNYSLAGWYYVTICTQDHISYFGKVKNEKMILNEIGKIADEYWNEIPSHYPKVSLDEYIIMPNHIHGIIIIYNVEDEYFPPKRLTIKTLQGTKVLQGTKIFVPYVKVIYQILLRDLKLV